MSKNNFFKGRRSEFSEFCPCGKSNKDGKFAPIEGNSGCGYCHSCCKFFSPNESENRAAGSAPSPPKQRTILHFSGTLVDESMVLNHNNKFIDGLRQRFDIEKVNEVIALYKIGASTHWNGSTVFWQIDELTNVKTGKIMLYDSVSLKRVKNPDRIYWIHKIHNVPNEKTQKCLFGLHLLRKFPEKTIYIVESEKTAIIASISFPEYLWMATACKGNLKYDLIKPLSSRKIVLIPDLDAHAEWCKIADRLKQYFDISVSNYLQKNASIDEKKGKFDLADYLLSLKDKNLLQI